MSIVIKDINDLNSVVIRQVKTVRDSTYCVYVPYNWHGKQVWYSFLDLDYKKEIVSKNGKVPIHAGRFRIKYPNEELKGKRVIIGLKDTSDIVKMHIEKELTPEKSTNLL